MEKRHLISFIIKYKEADYLFADANSYKTSHSVWNWQSWSYEAIYTIQNSYNIEVYNVGKSSLIKYCILANFIDMFQGLK